MKKFYMTLFALASLTGYAQHDCNTVVINDTDEQNGIFISGAQGQKAAADIPIAADQVITITHIKVTLASHDVPTYINFRFYSSIYNTPEDPEVAPGLIPGESLFDVTDTAVGEFVEIAYDPMHDFYIRDINVTLTTPIVLHGDQVDGRFWFGVLSDAAAWASTAHYETGDGVVGESLAMGADTFEWFQMTNLEQVYSLTAECATVLSNDHFEKNTIAVYPNPAHDVLNISLSQGQEITKTEIYSMTGQKVKEVNSQNINVANLASGVYMIKAQTNDNHIFNSKFVKN